MIYVDMKGNIGNQMFIYALARKMQSIVNQPINLSYYNLKKYFNINEESINIFELNENVEISNIKIPFLINSNNIVRKIFKKVIRSKKLLYKIKEIEFRFFKKKGILYWDDEIYKSINFEEFKKFKDIYIIGYWQSSKYFDDIKNILLKEFAIKDKLRKENEVFYNKIKEGNSICVSIRRGDYVTNIKNKKKYYLCDLDYFKKAIDIFKKEYDNIRIFCFSDDVDWVKNNINFDIETYFETENNSLSEKIMLMKECDLFVISNSSFSWWVQYLSSNRKSVIAPSRWYTDGSGQDIYEDFWIKIPVGSDLE